MKTIEQFSLGWRTDLIFARFDAEVHSRPDHLLIRTPHNPSFYWGNFLLYDRPPREGEAAQWLATFDAEIRVPQPLSEHLAFGVDVPTAFELPGDFAAAGLVLGRTHVLTLQAEQLRPPRHALAPHFQLRPLDLPREAERAVAQQVASDQGQFEPVGYRQFRRLQMQRYGRMVQAGLGHWFGVFARAGAHPRAGPAAADQAGAGPSLVADCGLFRDGHGPQALGRFQFVSTHPEWRRQGLCSALIHAVCHHGFERMGLHTLVIVADPDDVAMALYESLGFQRGTRTWTLERRPGAAPS